MQVEDFFISTNAISDIPNEAYTNTRLVVETFDAISRMTNHSYYIIDYYKKNFLYVSKNPLFLCAHTPEEVQQLGYQFFMNQVPKEELSMLSEINIAGFNFYKDIPIAEKTKFTISYNYHLSNKEKKILINQKLTPLSLTDDGRIWLAACVITLATHDVVGDIRIQEAGNKHFWKYSLENHNWTETEQITLNEKEKNVLSLSAQGYTMKEIADKMHLSLDSIKLYRKRLFEKLDTKNITETLAYISNHNL